MIENKLPSDLLNEWKKLILTDLQKNIGSRSKSWLSSAYDYPCNLQGFNKPWVLKNLEFCEY
jgi:hypothetical protein